MFGYVFEVCLLEIINYHVLTQAFEETFHRRISL